MVPSKIKFKILAKRVIYVELDSNRLILGQFGSHFLTKNLIEIVMFYQLALVVVEFTLNY